MRLFISAMILPAMFALAPADDDYFQQRVSYKIKVDLDPTTARLSGTEAIDYYNNSPDTLHEVYFHLYFNAFQAGSYLDRQFQEEGDYSIASTSERDIGFVNIDLLKNDGAQVKDHAIDNTIMRVPLVHPLPPGDSTYFYTEFTSQIPAQGFRAARSGNHFDVAQWYPKPAVYDRYGWHIDQYLSNGEFYGEYGDFDVEITMPDSFIIAHCGTLKNEEEVFGARLPSPVGDSVIVDALKYIRADSAPAESDLQKAVTSAAQQGKGSTLQNVQNLKIWKIRASNIHDFAFCADPQFMIDICRYGDLIIKSYYTPEVIRHWQRKAVDYTRRAIRFYSESCFPWPYDQYSTVVAAVSSGGMEYPDLTMISGSYSADNPYDHDLEATIAHEVGHAWFYGILGFNETAEAFLDEGLTSFFTIKYMENHYGRFENDLTYEHRWQKELLPNGNYRNEAQTKYIEKALTGTEDPLATPSEIFRDWWSYYVSSYHKAASVYFMLQFAMGDDKFDKFIDALFQRWAFKHPYFSNFQDLAEEIHGGDLDWFFHQWFHTTWTLDYALESVRSVKADSGGWTGFNNAIRIKNNGRCIAPLKLTVYYKDTLADTLTIPVSVWQKGVDSFDTTVFFESRPSKVTIDSDLMLADINRLNNSSSHLPPVTFQFMVPKFVYPKNHIEYLVDSYRIAHRPTAWYNSVGGIKLGYAFDGAYLEYFKRLRFNAALGIQSGHFDYAAAFDNALVPSDPRFSYFVASKELEGRGRQAIGARFESLDPQDPRMTQAIFAVQRNYLFDSAYLYGDSWSPGNVVTADLSFSRRFDQRFGVIILQGSLSNTTFGSDYQFRRAAAGLAISVEGVGVGKTNLQMKLGRADGDIPSQRRFSLSTADSYDIWDSPLFRSRGTLPDRWKDDGHLFKPGGAGLSGYLRQGSSGARLISVGISNDLPSPRLPFKIPVLTRQMANIRPQFYFAGGRVWSPADTADDFLYEAGLVVTYEVPFLGLLFNECRLSLHLPLWISKPQPDEDNLEWRWAFSITS
ncbi:MAG: hypothetical protein A2W25_14860 [candidate division Zixibacteria bacterium RBG_16_53_22]|nr:MAG: hypothetical protein A2W25_14860 [candidate division Zixibacteria bacterium RBG_16_53_22]